MQTTPRIDDALYRKAKAEAAHSDMTLTCFLQEGLRLRLEKPGSAGVNAPPRFRTYRQGEPFPWNDRQLERFLFNLSRRRARQRCSHGSVTRAGARQERQIK